jgi:hypothetical protein
MAKKQSVVVAGGGLALVLGCIPFGPATVRVQGTVLDSISQLPLPFATVSVRLINPGRELGSGESTVSDGRFIVDISVPAESGRTSEIEIIFVEDECEERYLLNSEDDILVEVGLGTLVLEVKDPILVPPCDQAP